MAIRRERSPDPIALATPSLALYEVAPQYDPVASLRRRLSPVAARIATRPGGRPRHGLPVFWLDLLLLVSLTIVVSLSAVGNILVVAMLVTPAAAARLLTDRLPVMLGLSATLGAASGVTGLFISYHANVAADGTIVLVATGLFGLVWLPAPSHGLIATSRWWRPASD